MSFPSPSHGALCGESSPGDPSPGESSPGDPSPGESPPGAPPVFARLDRLFQGQLTECAGTLVLGEPPPGAVPLAHLLGDPNVLHDVLTRNHVHLEAYGSDLRASASMWHMRYMWIVLPYTMAALTLLRHALPVHPSRMWLELDAGAQPLRLHVTEPGEPAPDDDAQKRYDGLVHTHLGPMVEAFHAVAKLSPRIAWVNVARHVQAVLDAAARHPEFAQRAASDRQALLDTPAWQPPDGAAFDNPLYQPPRIVRLPATPSEPARSIEVHRACCLFYKLRKPRFCGGCPLKPENLPPRRPRAP
ncbi:siderophore-iron reductase FhuF [Pseudomonadota bacterium AL_CKDN230030165-1A_HGKHYDSX7]